RRTVGEAAGGAVAGSGWRRGDGGWRAGATRRRAADVGRRAAGDGSRMAADAVGGGQWMMEDDGEPGRETVDERA
ncbi:hypothetical protein, partial [Streptomyces hygroscopicus]|uniref:hypothetical protein n=1 Tax=Streptomyces hygroscopicus TaxID=1912 RepID=UPI001C6609D0